MSSFTVTESRILSLSKERNAGTHTDARLHVVAGGLGYQRPKITLVSATTAQSQPGGTTTCLWEPSLNSKTRVQRLWLRWDIVNTSAANMTVIDPMSLIQNIKLSLNRMSVCEPESGYSTRAMRLLKQINLARLDDAELPEALYDAAQSFTPEDGVTIPAGQTKRVYVDVFALYPNLSDFTTNGPSGINQLLFEIQFLDKGSAQTTSQGYIASADVDILGAPNFTYNNIGLTAYEVEMNDPVLIQGQLTPIFTLPQVDFIERTVDMSVGTATASVKLSEFPSRNRFSWLFCWCQDNAITTYNDPDRCRLWSGPAYLKSAVQQFAGDSGSNVDTTDPVFRQMWALITHRALFGQRMPHERLADIDTRTRVFGAIGTVVNLSHIESMPDHYLHAGIKRVDANNSSDFEWVLSPAANGVLPAQCRVVFAAVSDRCVRMDPKTRQWTGFLL